MPGAGLQLFLRDFACEKLAMDLADEAFLIDAGTLSSFLHEAEEEDFIREEGKEERLNSRRSQGESTPQRKRRTPSPALSTKNDENHRWKRRIGSPLRAPTSAEQQGGEPA